MSHEPVTSERPRIGANDMHRLLREGRIADFNARRSKGENPDLRGCDLRGCDLRGTNFAGLDLSNSYFRQADLRGVPFGRGPSLIVGILNLAGALLTAGAAAGT